MGNAEAMLLLKKKNKFTWCENDLCGIKTMYNIVYCAMVVSALRSFE